MAEIEKLKERIEYPKSIQEYGIGEAEFLVALDEMALDAFDDQCTGANPRYLLIEELKEIYKRAYYGPAKEVKAVAKTVAKKATKKK